MKKIIKFFRLKWIEVKLLRAYKKTIIERKATWIMSSGYRNIFRDKAEKIREEWHRLKYNK